MLMKISYEVLNHETNQMIAGYVIEIKNKNILSFIIYYLNILSKEKQR